MLLLIVNGILAMSEIAIIASSRDKMKEMAKKSKKAKVASYLMDNMGEFLSTIQIGITIIGVVLGAFGGQKFAEPLGVWLDTIPLLQGYGSLIAFSLVVFSVTYISLVIGELVPKRIALSKPEKVAKFFAKPIFLLCQLTYPFVVVLNMSTKVILKVFGQKPMKESTITQEEIDRVLRQGFQSGVIDAFEHKVFQKVLQFGDKEVSMMMTPRIKVVFLDIEEDLEENKSKILSYPHRYYPVFEGGLDHFRGILDTKDLFAQQMQGKPFELNSLIKKAPYVIEGSLGPDLIKQFIKYKTHIAIVMDEYGAMQGIITLVNIFEALIGNIPESHQKKHYDIVVHRNDGSWLCDGLTPISSIEDLLKVEIVAAFEEVDFDTLAGFLLMHFKAIPEAGDKMEWDKFRFEIMDMDGTRIDKVLIQKK